jgi:hypothetical protein
MGQRLLLGIIFNFWSTSSPGVAALAMAFLCLAFALAHNGLKPMAAPTTQRLQAVLQFCLVGVAVAAVASAAVEDEAGESTAMSVDPASPRPVVSAASSIDFVLGSVVPLVLIGLVYGKQVLVRIGRCSQRSYHGTCSANFSQ